MSPQNAGMKNGNHMNNEHYTNYNHYKYIDFCSKDERKDVYDLTLSHFPFRQHVLIADDMYLHNDDNVTVIIEDRESPEKTDLQWLQWTFQVNILQLGSNWNSQVAQFEKQTQSYVLSHLTLPKDENSTQTIIANVTALGSEVSTFSKILDDYYITADKNSSTNSTTDTDDDTNDDDATADDDQGFVKAQRTPTFLPLNTSRIDGKQIAGIIVFLMAIGIMFLLVSISVSRRKKQKMSEKNFQINLLEINDDTGLGIEQILDSNSESEEQLPKRYPWKKKNSENDNNFKGQSRLLPTRRRKQKQTYENFLDDEDNDTNIDEGDFMVVVSPKQPYSVQKLDDQSVPFKSSTPTTVASFPRSPPIPLSPRSPLASTLPRSPPISPSARSQLAKPQCILLELDEDEESIIKQITNTSNMTSKGKGSYLKRKLSLSKKERREEEVEDNFDEEHFVEQVIISPKNSSSPS